MARWVDVTVPSHRAMRALRVLSERRPGVLLTLDFREVDRQGGGEVLLRVMDIAQADVESVLRDAGVPLLAPALTGIGRTPEVERR